MPDSQTRLDLARRLHDGLAQDLSLLGYSLDEIIGDPRLEQELRDSLRVLRLKYSSIAEDFRDELYRIRAFDREQLKAELPHLLRGLSHELDLDYPALHSELEDAVGHCLLELARNCIAHAHATNFTISWFQNEKYLVINAMDNGSGGLSSKRYSFGVRGLSEWLSPFGGTVEFTSDESGTKIALTIPKASA